MATVPAKKLSVLKRARQTITRSDRNRSVKSEVKTAIKKLQAAIEAKDKENITETLKATIILISSGTSKGVFHRNTASRTISRLSKRANKALTAEAT